MRATDDIRADLDLLKDETLSTADLESILARLTAERAEDPAAFDAIVSPPVAEEGVEGLAGARVWKNYVGDYRTTIPDSDWWEPESLGGIYERLATGTKLIGADKLRIKCIGAGHSSSDVSAPEEVVLDLGKFEGAGFHTHMRVDERRTIRAVRAGTRISTLNTIITKDGLALKNMGSYDGQYVVGALCTGTHGSGAHVGPIAESVVSLDMFVLEGKTWKLLRVERADGPTDVAGFLAEATLWPKEIQKDDALFSAVVIAVGCLGVVVSMTIELTESFWLREERTVDTWARLRGKVLANVEAARKEKAHWEFAFLPNPIQGDVQCFITHRTRVPAQGKPPERELTGEVTLAVTKLLGPMAATIAPALLPQTIYKEGFLKLTGPPYSPYTSTSDRVFILGYGDDQPITSNEIHVPLARAVEAVDLIVKLTNDNNWKMTSPVGVRFVGQSQQLLATSNGHEICTLEVTLMKGTPKLAQILATLERELRASLEARMHWGQRNVQDETSVRAAIGANWGRWLAFYRRFNANGTFNNRFTDRLGISMPSGATA